MTNREIAHILFNIATLLELANGNAYRIRAYRRAARWLLALREEVREVLAAGRDLPRVRGIGPRLRTKIGQLATEGRLAFYSDLLTEQHPAVQSLMTVPGVGPKTALRLLSELGITSPESLLFAARRGRIQELWGFGQRREGQLAEGAARVLATMGEDAASPSRAA